MITSSQPPEMLTQTVLYPCHLAAGAKMAPFAGFLMPIQYRGIVAEHMATRTKAAIFDTCHMGEFRLEGPTALADLEKLVSSRIGSMQVGQCRYGLMCNEQGGVVDDEITYRMGENQFFMVVNAGTQQEDLEWIRAHVSSSTRVENLSEQTAKLDLQGPGSAKIMQKLMDDKIDGLKYYQFMHTRRGGQKVLISRTGYTGEIGFEIYCDVQQAADFWNACLELGAEPAGLGARDTLRLEMGFALYGHELSTGINAAESGLPRSIASDKEFIGSPVALDESLRKNALVSLLLDGRKAARAGDVLLDSGAQETGSVTSGCFSPSLGKSIAMGYVRIKDSKPGTLVGVKNPRGDLRATVHEPPLYREATARKELAEFL